VTGGPWRSQRMVASVRSGVPVARSKRHVCATGFLFYFWWSVGRPAGDNEYSRSRGGASEQGIAFRLFLVRCSMPSNETGRSPTILPGIAAAALGTTGKDECFNQSAVRRFGRARFIRCACGCGAVMADESQGKSARDKRRS
jgi:hypothetical protein